MEWMHMCAFRGKAVRCAERIGRLGLCLWNWKRLQCDAPGGVVIL